MLKAYILVSIALLVLLSMLAGLTVVMTLSEAINEVEISFGLNLLMVFILGLCLTCAAGAFLIFNDAFLNPLKRKCRPFRRLLLAFSLSHK